MYAGKMVGEPPENLSKFASNLPQCATIENEVPEKVEEPTKEWRKRCEVLTKCARKGLQFAEKGPTFEQSRQRCER